METAQAGASVLIAASPVPVRRESAPGSTIGPSENATVPPVVMGPGKSVAAGTPPGPTVTPVALVDVPGNTPAMVVQIFYNALNMAISRDPSAYLRAYSYLSDSARQQTSYEAFVERYRTNSEGVTFSFSAPDVSPDGTARAMVTTTELRAGSRVTSRGTRRLVKTAAGRELNGVTAAE